MKKHRACFYWLVFIIIAFQSTSLFSQKLVQLDVLTTKQGLTFRNVISIAQDSLGFMWFGTEQGLNRFDAYEFKLYNSDKNNINFIEKDKISNNMYVVDHTNKLWYVANEQLFQLNLSTNKIKNFNHKVGVKGDVLYIHKDVNQQIWIVTDNRWKTTRKHPYQYLQKYTSDNRFVVIDSIPRGIREFTSISSDKKGHLFWATILSGVIEYTSAGKPIKAHVIDSFNWFGTKMLYTSSFFDDKNTWYYFPKSSGGVNTFNPITKKSKRLLNVSENIYHAQQDNENRIWFAGNTTLYSINKSGKIVDYSEKLSKLLPFTKINNLFIDTNQVIWLATDNGLIKLRLKKKLFEHLFNTPQKGWGNTMRSILETKSGEIIVMCERINNLMVIDSLNNKKEFKYKNITNKGDSPLYGSRFFVLDKDSTHLYTVNKSLMSIRLRDGEVTEFSKFSKSFNVTSANPIIRLKDGQLLFGHSLSKLLLFNSDTEEYNFVFKNLAKNKDITNLRYFLESKVPNQIWIGTQEAGLLKIDLNGTILAHYNSNSTPNLSKNAVLVLYEDEKLNLWIGTYGGGLDYLNPLKNTITNYNITDGLPNNNVVGILPYKSNYLWISTYNGLSVFNKTTTEFKNFFEEDGLTNNEFNYASFFKDIKGRFYFGGMNGVNRFEPKNIIEKSKLPLLHLTSITTYNNKENKELTQDWSQKENPSLEIDPYNQYFQVNWTLPNYFQSSTNQFYTKLEGFENKWFSQKNQPFIRYNRLPPGKYVLRVRGSDSNGNKSKKELILPIIVKQIYYKTWWFISLSILTIALVVFGLFKYRIRQIQAVERLRIKISSDLHDDVGSLLSGLAMQTEILELNAREEDKPKLQKITKISRYAIAQMRDLVWSIDSRRETVADLIERMHELAEDILLPKGIEYTIKKENIYLNKKLTIIIKQNLFFIYKEALTNIVRHSNAKKVTIKFKNKFDCCEVTIKDNGNKIRLKNSTGLGLANMAMRAEKMKAILNLETKNGFFIHLKLPFVL